MIKQVICLFHCVENALLPPLPKIFVLSTTKTKGMKDFYYFVLYLLKSKREPSSTSIVIQGQRWTDKITC